MITSRPNTPESNQARVVQFSGLSDVSSRRPTERATVQRDEPLQRFCNAFDSGDVVLFFSLWKSFLPTEARGHTQV